MSVTRSDGAKQQMRRAAAIILPLPAGVLVLLWPLDAIPVSLPALVVSRVVLAFGHDACCRLTRALHNEQLLKLKSSAAFATTLAT